MEDKKLLDIVLITYNHSNYIEEALESILLQETLFDFNIIIADDYSSDNTLEKIKKFEEENETSFIYLENNRNLGIMKNYQKAFNACQSKYVAVLEGDDRWVNKYRLQKHIDFLEEHFECSMSANQLIIKDNINNKYIFPENYNNSFYYISPHMLINDNKIGNFSACVYRNQNIKKIPDSFYALKAYDWLFNILMCSYGLIGYINQPLSIYNLNQNGIWSSQTVKEKLYNQMIVIDDYNKYTDYVYNAEFIDLKNKLKKQLYKEKLFFYKIITSLIKKLIKLLI